MSVLGLRAARRAVAIMSSGAEPLSNLTRTLPGKRRFREVKLSIFRKFCNDARPVGRLDAWASSSRQRLPSRRSDAVASLQRCRFAGRASPPAGTALGAAGALLAATSRVTSLTAVALLNEITTAFPFRASWCAYWSALPSPVCTAACTECSRGACGGALVPRLHTMQHLELRC